jgi:hypothetical protein
MKTKNAVIGQIHIAVPRAYQDYLIAQKDKRCLICTTLLIAIILAFKAIPDYYTVIGVPIALVIWISQRRKKWQYTISPQEITVIWSQLRGRSWDWHTVQWKRQAVLGVEETEWRGLPALRLLGQAKNPKHRPDWLIVYAYEDRDKMQTQVLPLIERCRTQYREDSLAERLRAQPLGDSHDTYS